MSPKNYSLLIVDDSTDNVFLLQSFLQSEGYWVEAAYDGVTGLQKMREAPPDLVLLDVMMPKMNGYELTRLIRQDSRLSHIPIVLVTAYIEACRIKGLAAGATDFIRKPVNFDELHSTIQTILNRCDGRKNRPIWQEMLAHDQSSAH